MCRFPNKIIPWQCNLHTTWHDKRMIPVASLLKWPDKHWYFITNCFSAIDLIVKVKFIYYNCIALNIISMYHKWSESVFVKKTKIKITWNNLIYSTYIIININYFGFIILNYHFFLLRNLLFYVVSIFSSSKLLQLLGICRHYVLNTWSRLF